LTDIELVERVRGGDDGAFRVLYDRHVDRVFRLAFRMAGREDLARDFVQEAFVRVYRKLHQFRGDAAFSTWLHSVTVSVTLNGLRKVERLRDRERALDDVAPPTAAAPSVEPWLRKRLVEAIEGLPDIYRTVFVMHDLEGFAHAEIADALDVAEGTSKARLSRARARLREALDDVAREYVG